jgi:hypothetical protein
MVKSDQLGRVATGGSAVFEGVSEGSDHFVSRNT